MSTVTHRIDRLADDMRAISVRAGGDMIRTVRSGLQVGNTVAKDYARVSARKHGRLYHKAFSWEMRPAFHGFGGSTYSGEYGPDISKDQGEMQFEEGSRNQSSPHNNLAKSADLIGPAFQGEVHRLPDKWFW